MELHKSNADGSARNGNDEYGPQEDIKCPDLGSRTPEDQEIELNGLDYEVGGQAREAKAAQTALRLAPRRGRLGLE